jgi:hypothetical protein
MRATADTLNAIAAATGACLVYLACKVFVFAVRMLRGATRLVSAEFREFMTELDVKTVVIAGLAFTAVYSIVWSIMVRRYEKKREHERKLVAASRLASQLRLKKESRVSGMC